MENTNYKILRFSIIALTIAIAIFIAFTFGYKKAPLGILATVIMAISVGLFSEFILHMDDDWYYAQKNNAIYWIIRLLLTSPFWILTLILLVPLLKEIKTLPIMLVVIVLPLLFPNGLFCWALLSDNDGARAIVRVLHIFIVIMSIMVTFLSLYHIATTSSLEVKEQTYVIRGFIYSLFCVMSTFSLIIYEKEGIERAEQNILRLLSLFISLLILASFFLVGIAVSNLITNSIPSLQALSDFQKKNISQQFAMAFLALLGVRFAYLYKDLENEEQVISNIVIKIVGGISIVIICLLASLVIPWSYQIATAVKLPTDIWFIGFIGAIAGLICAIKFVVEELTPITQKIPLVACFLVIGAATGWTLDQLFFTKQLMLLGILLSGVAINYYSKVKANE